MKSCTILAVQADGAEMTTIEGLAQGEVLHPVQEGFWEEHGLVRLLHAGDDHDQRAAVRAESEPDRRGDPARAGRQFVPLHRLSAHRQCRAIRGPEDAPGWRQRGLVLRTLHCPASLAGSFRLTLLVSGYLAVSESALSLEETSMIPAAFDYRRPTNLAEAVQLLAAHADDAKILAGGHSLVPMMKLRLATPTLLIDIGRLSELSGIREQHGTLIIGAGTTHYAAESSALLQQRCPLLAETAAAIGDVQVRNRGTIGGSIAHADPAADWPAAVLAVGAQLKLIHAGGERMVSAADFLLTCSRQPWKAGKS